VAVSGGDEKRPDEPVTWETIEEVAAEAQLDRWKGMSDAEVRAALEAEKVDPARLERLRKLVGAGAAAGASAEPAGKVVSMDERRKGRRWTRGTLWLVAASLAGYGALQLGGGVGAPHPPETEAQLRARSLREEAFAACDEGKAGACREKLDEARALDPQGEKAGEVTAARERIKQLEVAEAGER
jgi:hypothetical protein